MAKKADQSGKLRLFSGLSAAVFAAAIGGGQAAAQEAAGDEDIVVTGFRASLEAAIDMKRDSVGAVDAIVAEDIADFPDANLSESIQRIPGVALARNAGEGRQISVRGLGPQFTRVRINGMETLGTVGATDAEGGTNRGRNFDFNIFASDLFNSIVVRKTASAETEEGSLGATVDLRTARPFDYEGFTFAVSGQAGYNDLSEHWDPRGAVLISDRWMNGDLGALLSVAYSNREAVEEGSSAVRWLQGGFGAETDPNLTLAQINAAFHPRIPRYDYYTHEQERIGITGALQWRPSNATQVSLDVLRATFDAERNEAFLQAPSFSVTGAGGLGGTTVTSAQIAGNSLVYGVFNGVDIRSEQRHDEFTTDFTQIGLTLDHEFSDTVRFSAFGGWAESDHDNPVQTTLLWDRNDITGYVYDYRGDNRLPLFQYGAVDVNNPASWTLSQIRLRPQTALNTYWTSYGDLDFDVSEWLTLSGGLNWKRFEFKTTELRRSNGTTSNIEATVPGFASGTPTANYAQTVRLPGGFDLPGGLPRAWAVPRIETAASLWNLYDRNTFRMGPEPALANNQNIVEESTGAYVQAEWDTELGSMPFRGNIGVRYVETDLTSVGFTFASGSPVRQTVDVTYEDTLPSLNMVIEPFDSFLVRFAAAKTMSRPNLGQLGPGAAVSVSGSSFTVTAGNPELDPIRANAYDLSFEWYFAEGGLLSLALFRKDIDTFVQTVRSTGPFTGNVLGLPDSVAVAACGATPGCTPAAPTWQFNLPRNTPGGPVQGFELGVQMPFFFLDGWLSNFGVSANYTYVESEIDYVGATGLVTATDDLTGLSRRGWNATFYYEDDRFSARVSGAYRSDYITTIPGRDGNAVEATAETLNVDFSSSYALTDNLRFTLEGLNLTDEVADQFLDPDDRSSFYHHYGRTYSVGFRYTY